MPDGMTEHSSLRGPVGGDPKRGPVAAGHSRPLASAPAPFVVVLGMHRSGTSLCADVLGRLGVAMADEPDAQPSNPRGHWERPEIVRRHDRILEMFERGYHDPRHDLPLPAGWWLDPAVAQIRREIMAFLEQKRAAGMPFGFKDPRTARLLPLWQQIFDELAVEPKIVLCLRNPVQVARSLEERDGLPADLGEYRWFTYTAEIFRHLRNSPTCVIEYERWFEEGGENLTKLTRFLGLQNASGIVGADPVDHQLRHDDLRHREPQHYLVRTLYELARRVDHSGEARAEIDEMLDRLAAFEQLQQPMQREFEHLSRVAAALMGRKPADGSRSPVSWRDATLADKWRRLLNASREAATLSARLEQVLRQRAELDAALARAQQDAALRNSALEATAQELAALRQQLEKRDAAAVNGDAASS